MLIKDLLKHAQNQLKIQGITSYDLDSKLLLAHILKVNREEFYKYDYIDISTEKYTAYNQLISARAKHKPLAKIIGKKEFYSLDFYTNLSTLDPRPDTETIVDTALELSKTLTKPSFLEIGVGTGCIAISLLKNGDFANSDAVDISKKALKLCTKNLKKHNLLDKLKLHESDLFSEIKKKYDLIISNPPYIPSKNIEKLDKSVKNFDPIHALDGGEDGLYFYRKIAQQSHNYLKKNAFIILEIGQNQEEAITAIFQEKNYSLTKSSKDLAGIVRCLVFKRNC
jgi:release factor glutamine methyltransferase